MAKIHLKVTTGEEFTISNAFYGDTGPLTDRNKASVQMSFIITKLATIGTDQGRVVNTTQIVYQWIED